MTPVKQKGDKFNLALTKGPRHTCTGIILHALLAKCLGVSKNPFIQPDQEREHTFKNNTVLSRLINPCHGFQVQFGVQHWSPHMYMYIDYH